MKRTYIWLPSLFFLLLAFACGRRTVPVPYGVSDVSLPIVQMQKPVYKGDWLFISWSVDTGLADATADVFFLKAYENTRSCRYCNNVIIETIEISNKEFSQTDLMRFSKDGQRYGLYLGETIHEKWQNKGLYKLTISYRTESGLNAEQSENISPTLSNTIVRPEITVLKTSEIEKTPDLSVLIEWKLVPEHVYRVINQGQTSREITKHYGLNLYQAEDYDSLETEKNITDRPLMSGRVILQIGDLKLFARHVDRFGNESEKVFLLDNSVEETMEDGNP